MPKSPPPRRVIDLSDWEPSKENILPLRKGRNLSTTPHLKDHTAPTPFQKIKLKLKREYVSKSD